MKKIFRAKICVPAPLVATTVLTQNKGPGTEAHSWNPPRLLRRAPMPSPPPQSNFRAAIGENEGKWGEMGGKSGGQCGGNGACACACASVSPISAGGSLPDGGKWGKMGGNGGTGGGKRGNGGKWGEMGGDGGGMGGSGGNWGELGGNVGEWGGMGGNGAEWGEMGRNGGKWGKGGKWGEMGNRQHIRMGNVGITSNMGEKWGKWEQNEHSPVPPFFWRSKTTPTISFVKIKSPHSPTEKRAMFPLSDTHRPSGWYRCLMVPSDC